MQNIYHNLPRAKRKIEENLRKVDNYKNIKIGNFYDADTWLSGDGDGNDSVTAQSLQQNIDLFKKEIRQQLSQYQDPKELIDQLQKLKLSGNAKEQLENLIYRVENFGFRYAKIDIRHDAPTINAVVVDILIAIGKLDEHRITQLIRAIHTSLHWIGSAKSNIFRECPKFRVKSHSRLNPISAYHQKIYPIVQLSSSNSE